jgi:enediyne biosynthesis protein E4
MNYMRIKHTFLIILLSGLSLTFVWSQQFNRVLAGPLANTPGDSRSVNWVDVNQDGYMDCLITNGASIGQNNALYINNGAGNFTLVTGDPIVNDGEPSVGATCADADNDGDIDCFAVNWYNVDNMYFLNEGDGDFSRNTAPIIANDNGYSETASWGDYDQDGLVDLYVTNSAGLRKNFLYHNDGDTAFTKIITGAAVNDAFDSRCVNWTDIDLDGDLDLFVTNETNQNENLYRNDGAGTFTALTTGALLNDGGNTMSSSWGDIDNDGDLDVFLANSGGYSGIFRNDGNFLFVKLVSDTTAKILASSFSSAWSDVDNDADLDLFVTNAFNSAYKWNNFLYFNDGSGNFTRADANEPPAADSAWSYGCAFADYDNDGFEDLVVATCKFASVDEPELVYKNNANSNHWITFSLHGTISNESAIGTKIFVSAIIGGDTVNQMREISAQSSYCGQNDIRAHFGLADADSFMFVAIQWPSGIEEIYGNLPVDTFIHIVEGQGVLGIPSGSSDVAAAFSLFPCPAGSFCTLRKNTGSFEKDATVSVFNQLGQCLKTIEPAPGLQTVELMSGETRFASGVYFVRIVTGINTVTLKMIVE